MNKLINEYFHLARLGTNIKTELLAGLTTFVTMAYIIIVNPKILEAAGMPFGPSMVATILSAFFGTMLMGLYAKRPFAIAPYMGENAFIAYTVVGVLGYSWETALGAIFISGILFVLLTVFKIRSWLANSIPNTLKISFAVGIGLFLTFIGLNESGIVSLGVAGAPVEMGNIRDTGVLLSILGFILISVLMIKKVNGAILIGILAVTLLAFLFGAAPIPTEWVSSPPSIEPVFMKFDIAGALTWGFLSVILTLFVMAFVDTLGTLLGLGIKAGILDEKGEFPEIEKPMLCDALATTAGAVLGTTTTGAFIESATGIQAGGKSGLTAVVVGLLFLVALFFAPFFTAVPAFAYGPSLIVVGLLMMSTITKFDFKDLAESIPFFSVIVLMSFTFNIGIGITAGFILYPLFKIVTGKIREIKTGLWILAFISLLFYIFYPY